MTQDRELLLKDLCARLPYGVMVNVKGVVYDNRICRLTDIHHGLDTYIGVHDGMQYHIESIKPYLFPLSSMTEEQKKEYEDALTYHDYVEGGWTIAKSFDDEYIIPYWFVDFCNKYHFDFRGLIPKGIAIDATGLNVY